MSRHIVVGTAGHVDHGKTALVKALTGIDTDRWEEEKRRGITIDLGFAHLQLGDDLVASIVDVPGHEDFVRNMLAGATGFDVALLVVAADEGIMPQTLEHLAIIEFLGVGTGVVALTKVDLVEREWLELVATELTERLGRSSVRWGAPVLFSAVTGQGAAELREALVRAAGQAVGRPADDLFRLPVDRVFSVAGAGTVVTGTTWSGSISAGDEVRVLPVDVRTRVRSVEVHGAARDRAEPGRRTALALPGVEKARLARGCVVVDDATWRPTSALDVMLTLLPDAPPVTQRSRVRLHIGTAEVLARVTPAADQVAPGGTGAVRFRLEEPLVARWGDRGVVRSYSPVRTIGGCIVGDPYPPKRPRRPVGLEARLVREPAQRVLAVLETSGESGVTVTELPVRSGLHPATADRVVAEVERGGAVHLRDRLILGRVVSQARDATLAALAGHHRARPLESGMPRELLRAAVTSADLADHVQGALEAEGRIVLEGSVARLAEFTPRLSTDQARWTATLQQALSEAGPLGLTEQELAEQAPGAPVRALLDYQMRHGTVLRVGRDRYFDAGALRKLRDLILDVIRELGRATPSELRDRTGLTRKYLIPILEWLDGTGQTVREGDARRIGTGAADEAPPS